MSAIGNYVHLDKENYKRYGIVRIGENGDTNPSQRLNDIKNQIIKNHKNNILVGQAKDLENKYMKILYPDLQDKLMNEIKKQILDKIEQDLNKEFNKNDANYSIGEDLSVIINNKEDLRSIFSKLTNSTQAQYTQLTKVKSETVKKLRDDIKKIETFINENIINISKQSKSYTFQEQQQIIAQINKDLEKIKKKLEDTKILASKRVPSVVEAINKFINYYNGINTTVSNQLGYVGEYFFALANLLADDTAKEKIDETVFESAKNVMTGKAKDLFGYRPGYGLVEEKEIKDENGFDVIKVRISKTRKPDIQGTIFLENEKKELKEVNTNLSVKNSGGTTIKLTDETNLYDILNYIRNMDFVNHYLNIVTVTKDKEVKRTKWDGTPSIKDMNNAVAAYALEIALQGYSNQNAANFLVINDIKNRQIHVYSIPVLLQIYQNKIINGEYGYSSDIKGISSNFIIKQKREETVKERLGIVLKNLQDTKITVKVSKAS